MNEKRIAYVILIIYSFLTIIPFYWTLITSFKAEDDIFSENTDFFPKPTLKYYKSLLTEKPEIEKYTYNSFTIAVIVAALSLILSIPAGFGFGRYKNWIHNLSFGIILGSRLLPSIAFIVPFAIIYSKLNLIDTKFGLIAAHLFFALPFSIWLLEGFYASIPYEIEEAAKIDGCNKFQIFWYIDMPLVKSGIIAVIILSFLYSWWEYPFAATLMRRVNLTLPVGIVQIYKDDFVVWNFVAAATIISAIPGVLFSVFFQRFMVAGMTQGSVKE